jgi:hypothetical protein
LGLDGFDELFRLGVVGRLLVVDFLLHIANVAGDWQRDVILCNSCIVQ